MVDRVICLTVLQAGPGGLHPCLFTFHHRLAVAGSNAIVGGMLPGWARFMAMVANA